jgi:transcriptional regulator with XRE-family HTH domain
MIHIGKKIKEVIQQKGMTIAAFREKAQITRQNMDNIFLRESIDTDKLLYLSQQLDYDFFQHYSTEIHSHSSLSDTQKEAIRKEIEAFAKNINQIITKNE